MRHWSLSGYAAARAWGELSELLTSEILSRDNGARASQSSAETKSELCR